MPDPHPHLTSATGQGSIKMSIEKHSCTSTLVLSSSDSDSPICKSTGQFNPSDYLDPPPDGGFDAWLCCACITAMNMVTWGETTAFSIFLAFYLENQEFPGAKPRDYALIGGLVIFFTLALTPVANLMLLKVGYRATVSFGILLQVSALIGASYVKSLSGLYGTQGALMGISSGIIFGANLIVLPTWFLKHRALANAITHFGLGLGGVVLSLVVNALIQRTGDQRWALRALGIISGMVLTVCMLLVKVRETTKIRELQGNSMGQLIQYTFNYKVWSGFAINIATLWAFLANIGYAICLFSFANYTRSLGYSHEQATTVTVVISGAQAVGRPLMGVFNGVIGTVNLTMFCTFYTCVMVFAFWINITGFASLIGLSFTLGLFMGISSVNVIPLLADASGLADFPSALSYSNFFVGVSALIAEMIGLSLRDYKLQNLRHRTPYFYCQLFVGSIYFAALIALLPYRAWKVGRMCEQMKLSPNCSESERFKFAALAEDCSTKGYLIKMFYPAKV